MAKNVLAVYDQCQVYLERFLNYVNNRKRLDIEAVGFTDPDILEDYLKNNRIRALLFSRENNEEGEDKGQDNFIKRINENKNYKTIFLGDRQESAEGAEDDDGIRYLYKYQSMEDLLTQLNLILAEDQEEESSVGYDSRINVSGIYSPQDKQSHPEIAAAIRRKQIPADARVLYINLEPFSGMEELLDYRKDTGIEDVIYYYKTNPGMLPKVLGKMKGSYCGMDVLTAPDNLDDLEELGKEGWPDFLAGLCRNGDYQYVLLDISSFSGRVIELVIHCGNLYIPALPQTKDDRALDRMREFRQYFIDKGQEEYLKKIVEVQIDFS